jgi:phage terminase small subunit
METPDINPLDKLNPKQKKFVIEFMDCLNGSEAARRAGYSARTANRIASENLTKPDIQAAVSYLGEQLGMSSGEAIKHFTDIARTRINTYMKVVKVLKTPMVRKSLQQLIDELDFEIEFEDEFARVAKLSGEELSAHKVEQKRRELQGIRYALELERNPKAYRDVPGESVWVDDVVPDLVALATAKGEGRIKSLKFNEHGPMIELESASNALDKILQLHGRYKQLPGDANQPKELQGYQLPDGTTIIF